MKTCTKCGEEKPLADSPEDDSPCQWDPMCTGRGTARITDGGHTYTTCDDCADDAMTEDSPEDVTSENHSRIALDGGHADVDTFVDHVELTIRLGDRIVFGFQLSHREAEKIGMALEFARTHDERVTALARAGHVEASSRLAVDGHEVDQ